MIISITAQAKTNGRPTSIGSNSLSMNHGEELTFTVDDFTTDTTPQYSDPEGDSMSYIKIKTIPQGGDIKLNGTTISVNSLVYSGSISSGDLKYVPNVLIENENKTSFSFDVADTGSQSLSGLTGANMSITAAAKINYPPDSVGDNAINSNYGTTVVFTSSNFTTETTPPYSDPEGDAAYSIKVLTLPSTGTLYLDGVSVVVNQEILLSEIDLDYLVYSPALITAASSVSFTFAVSDLGSRQFTS